MLLILGATDTCVTRRTHGLITRAGAGPPRGGHSQDPAVLYGLPPGSRGTHIQGGAFIPSYYLTQY